MKYLALPLLISLCAAVPAQADEADLQNQIRKLNNELQQLKAQIQATQSQTEAIAEAQEAAGSGNTNAVKENPLSIWGYGEIGYTRPTHDSSATTMDLTRAVFGFGYRFDDKTRFMSEFEIEHAVASADDQGEVEVEQFYVDHQLGRSTHLKAGLFLIPMGLLNETHEPNRYYGVFRNYVETAIIPTTWREGGAALYGSTENGLAWDVGLTTGFNLANWDATSTEGQESPLGSIHQELQNAKARDLSTYLALNYRGIPGLVAGASVFTGKISQGDATVALANDSRATLWEGHTRWTPGNWDLSTLYAKGTISNTADLNLTLVGNPSLIPEEFWGWYTQAAYKFDLGDNQAIAPFVRYTRYNTGAEYAPLPAGLEVATLPTETITTYGANYYLTPNVVFKADYQHFSENTNNNRYDLGLGLAF